MNPVFERQVIHPPVLGSAMIRHHVHNNAHSMLFGLRHESPVKPVASEARVYVIIVGSRIAMV